MAELLKIPICNKIILNRTNIKVENCTTDTDKVVCETAHQRAVDWVVSPKSLPIAYVKEKLQICCAVTADQHLSFLAHLSRQAHKVSL